MSLNIRRHVKPGFLFVNPKTMKPWHDIKKALQRAAVKAGIDQRVYLHLLRHSFGTHAVQSGVNLRSIQLLMGHSSSKVTEIYTTLANTFLNHEMDKFGGGALRRGKPQGKKGSKQQGHG